MLSKNNVDRIENIKMLYEFGQKIFTMKANHVSDPPTQFPEFSSFASNLL